MPWEERKSSACSQKYDMIKWNEADVGNIDFELQAKIKR